MSLIYILVQYIHTYGAHKHKLHPSIILNKNLNFYCSKLSIASSGRSITQSKSKQSKALKFYSAPVANVSGFINQT